MSVTHRKSTEDNEVVIQISDKFEFSSQKQFREAYQSYDSGCRFIVDMGNVDYMDSSALGMLLMLRDHAGGNRDNLVLRAVSPTLQKVLSIANFERMFTFS